MISQKTKVSDRKWLRLEFFPLFQKIYKKLNPCNYLCACKQKRNPQRSCLDIFTFFFLPWGKFANMKIHGENLNIWYLTVLRCLLLTQVTSSPSSSQQAWWKLLKYGGVQCWIPTPKGNIINIYRKITSWNPSLYSKEQISLGGVHKLRLQQEDGR